MAEGNKRGDCPFLRLRSADGDTARSAGAGRLGDPATLRHDRRRDRLAQLERSTRSTGRRAGDADWPRRCSLGRRSRRGRAARAGVRRDLDAHQARLRGGISGVGAAHRGGAVEGAGFPGLSFRTAGTGRAGRLACHSALRQRGEPTSVVRVRRNARSSSKRQSHSRRNFTRASRAPVSISGSPCRPDTRRPLGSRTCSFC